MKTARVPLLALVFVLSNFTPRHGTAAELATTGGTPPAPTPAKTHALSPGLDDIVKMHDAGVDEAVIRAYVRNSDHAYYVTADDIIKLRDLGISPGITVDLMERGGELRRARNAATAQMLAANSAQLAQNQAEAANYQSPAGYQAPEAVQPTPDDGYYSSYPGYTQDYPYYGYPYYGYPYAYWNSYPYWGWNNWWWPGYVVYYFNGHDHDHDHGHGHDHGTHPEPHQNYFNNNGRFVPGIKYPPPSTGFSTARYNTGVRTAGAVGGTYRGGPIRIGGFHPGASSFMGYRAGGMPVGGFHGGGFSSGGFRTSGTAGGGFHGGGGSFGMGGGHR